MRAREAAGNQRPWPADKVERWGIDRLIPYAKNAPTHSDAQIAAIAASIKEWGWTTPALVGEDVGLIAGHARILAARQLGIAEIPVPEPIPLFLFAEMREDFGEPLTALLVEDEQLDEAMAALRTFALR